MRSKKLAIIAALVIPFTATFAWGQLFGGKASDIQKGLKLFKSAEKTVKATQPMSPEEEKTIGRAIAAEVFMRFGPRVTDASLNKYVTSVGKVVSANVGDGKTDFHFAIVDSPEANAFAAPGGYVFITTGLLAKLETEAQLAGVLAHEAAHVTEKHMVDAIQRMRKLSGLAEVSATMLDKDPEALGKIVAFATDILFTKGLDKDLEFEADTVGVRYAAQAGYDAKGLFEFLQRLKSEEGKSPSIFFSTHPSTGDRIARIEKNDLPRYGSGAVLKDRFAKVVH